MREVHCPRCGYDQRGAIVTWTETCPLEGTCSECGLKFEWPELLSDHVRWPRWCVEFATGLLVFPIRAATTLAFTVWPWGFWRSLRMHHEIRWRRIIAYLVLLSASTYILFSVGQGLIAVRVWSALQRPNTMVNRPVPTTINAPLSAIVIRAMFAPFSTCSPSTIAYGGLKLEFPSPASFLPDVNGSTFVTTNGVWVYSPQWDGWYYNPVSTPPPSVYSPGRSWFARGVAGTLALLGHCALTLVFSTALFAVLPQTRQRYKVRWSHLVRIAVYAFATLTLPLLIYIEHGQISRMLLHSASFDLHWLFWLCFVYWPLWLICWWAAASRLYMRIPHAWGVAASVVLAGMLCSFACGYLSMIARALA